MLNKLRNRAQDEKGFTLIELLVVILIIGILAAIALPAFLNQRGKAQDTAAKSQVRTMQTAEETYYTDEQAYTDFSGLQGVEPSLNDLSAVKATTPPTAVASGGPPTDAYVLTSTSKTGNAFTITKTAAGVVTRACGPTGGKFGCPNSRSW
jgi:type IV pilus assembly protein PilA